MKDKVRDKKVEEAIVEKTDEEKGKEAIEILKNQLVEHQKKAEHHQTMALKAQGALEVLLQLYPENKENK